ncbi:MAG: DUF3168 domain-containing protein [Candidatus Saccharibacteria bacterium]|nr:DUF3168 domain-containing protein [Pseudorhodobacter sp.]
MSYAAAAALQLAVYARLTAHSALTGVTVVDAVAPGGGKGKFILLGPETASDKGDNGHAGAEHQFQVSVISDETGFLTAKSIAAHVCEALVGSSLTMSVGFVVEVSFLRAVARRLKEGEHRRIDMVFRARVDF